MSNYNPINENPALRKVFYLIQWIVNLVMGALGIVLAATQGGLDSLPVWYVTANLVFNFIWTYTGLTAQANTPQTVQPVKQIDT